jgi:hypothetical protein
MKIRIASPAAILSLIGIIAAGHPALTYASDLANHPISLSQKTSPQLKSTVTLTKKRGQNITICTPGAKCSEAKMPAQLGDVTKLVQGEFVSNEIAKVSWIARSPRRAYLCYQSKSIDDVHCTPIKAPSIKNAEISFTKKDGANVVIIIPNLDYDDSAKSRRRITQAMMQFGNAIKDSAQLLEAKAEDEVFSPTTIDNSGCADCPDDGGGGEDDGGDDGWGDWGGGGGGGGGDGGGGGLAGPPITDGSFTCGMVGPTVVCSSGPPPPLTDPYDQPLPPGPSDPWYCSWFGLACPGAPQLPPPIEPIGPPSGTTPGGTVPPYPANPPTTPPTTPKWTAEDELEKDNQICFATYERDMDECAAYNSSFGAATYITCSRRAGDYLASCQTAARDKYKANK